MKITTLLILLLHFQIAFSQETEMKSLEVLIHHDDSTWMMVEDWIQEAKNEVEVLPRDFAMADTALYLSQITTKSPMGAIIHNSGGILVKNGWIRILGSGSDKLERNLPEWNKDKTFHEYGKAMSHVLIADDAIGGAFAINKGEFGKESIGQVYYFSPKTIEWHPLDKDYAEFLRWTFSGDLDQYYEGLWWDGWEEKVQEIGMDSVINYFPYFWVEGKKEGKMQVLSTEYSWILHMLLRLDYLDRD